MLSEQTPIQLFYNGRYQTLGDKLYWELYVCSVRVFMPRIQVLSDWESKWWEKGRLLSNTCPTQMVNSVRIKPKLVCEFFADGWLLLWCEEGLASIYLVFVDKNSLFELKTLPKWCSDGDHASPINHQYFLMTIRRLKCSIVIKDHRFRELQLVVFTYFDQFPPREGDITYCYCSCTQMRVGTTYNRS